VLVASVAGLVRLVAFPPEAAASALPTPPIEVSGGSLRLAAQAPQWKYIEIESARAQPPVVPLPAPGRVAFDESRLSAVGAPLSGRVDQVRVRLGDRVRRGDKLFSVRSGELAGVEHDILDARASLEVRKRVVERTKDLVQLRAAPEKDLLQAEAELKQAEIALNTAMSRRDSLRVAQDGSNLFWLTAQRDGAVVELNVSPNQEVGPDHNGALLKVADLSEVIVLADLQERDAAELKAGQAVEIHTQASPTPLAGVVEHVTDVVDPVRRTLQVRIRAKNDARLLRANAFVEVAILPNQGDRVRVPSGAVVTDGNRSVVFVASADGQLNRTSVNIGRERDGQVEILSGLNAGERYVSRGALLLLNEVNLAR
jgi:cobalt-zinc-cadmium efflux system membrane fusion protein